MTCLRGKKLRELGRIFAHSLLSWHDQTSVKERLLEKNSAKNLLREFFPKRVGVGIWTTSGIASGRLSVVAEPIQTRRASRFEGGEERVNNG